MKTHVEANGVLHSIDTLLRQLAGNRYHERAYPVTSVPDTTLAWGWTRLSYGKNHDGKFEDLGVCQIAPWPIDELLNILKTSDSLAEFVDRARQRPRTRRSPGYHPGAHCWQTGRPTSAHVPAVADVLAVIASEGCGQELAVRLLGGQP